MLGFLKKKYRCMMCEKDLYSWEAHSILSYFYCVKGKEKKLAEIEEIKRNWDNWKKGE